MAWQTEGDFLVNEIAMVIVYVNGQPLAHRSVSRDILVQLWIALRYDRPSLRWIFSTIQEDGTQLVVFHPSTPVQQIVNQELTFLEHVPEETYRMPMVLWARKINTPPQY
jgi:hypothetical protein